MELRQFAEELKARMSAQMESISMDEPDALSRTSKLIACIEASVHELKQFVIKYKFGSGREEIEFFKVIKPGFVSQLLYHQILFRIQLFESFNGKESTAEFYEKMLTKLQGFLNKHRQFYQYILSNQGHLDEGYFLRVKGGNGASEFDERFSTPFEIKLSRILCKQLIQEYLLKSVQKLQRQESPNSTLSWTGSKTDLVELVYALHVSGVFNKSSADVKQIATHFENVFNVTLGNYYRTFQEIRIRKTGQVKFMSELREGLIKLMAEKDL